MAVRLHYRASRPHTLTTDDVTVARGLLAAHHAALDLDAAPLTVDHPDAATLTGAADLPAQDPFATFLALAHWCHALTELRRALPGTDWHVAVDDEPVPWDDATGFGWPEQRDPAVLAEMAQLRAGA